MAMMDGDDLFGEFDKARKGIMDVEFLKSEPGELRFSMPYKPEFEQGRYERLEDQVAAMGVHGLFDNDYMVVTRKAGGPPLIRPLMKYGEWEFDEALASRGASQLPYIAKVISRETDESGSRCIFTLKLDPGASFGFTPQRFSEGEWKAYPQ
jgi:hypothetical protein